MSKGKALIDEVSKLRAKHLDSVRVQYAECLVDEIKRVTDVYDIITNEAAGRPYFIGTDIGEAIATKRDDHIEYTKTIYADCLANEIKHIGNGWDTILDFAITTTT